MWIGDLPPFFWPDRREVLPSIAITSTGAPISGAPINQVTHETKQRWNCSASSVAISSR